jgi:ubiquinone/menaquinone biosynthesis C-methylase UbiE
MNKHQSDSSQVAASWDTYWHGTGDVGAYSSGGASHPAILEFWDEFFQTVKQDYITPKIIDIASGNGAVLERALATFGDEQADFTCLDVSEAAITNIRSRFPRVNGIVTDARTIPLDSGSFDIATSQFGVEYAGLEAINEVTRLLVTGGRLALLLHSQGGSIHRECVESLDAIVRLQESRFIPYAIAMFSAGFKAVRGADRAPYEAAAKKLAPAIGALEAIMKQYGQHVASDTIARLYNDVDQIHQGIQHYEPTEVLDWLGRMDGELDAYAGRMSSMGDSAIDNDVFEKICDELRSRDYTIERAEPLVAPDHDLPLAWVLIATKENIIR